MIEQLPVLAASATRRDRTRARCHKALERQAQSRLHKRFVVERAIFLGFGAIYLSSLAINVLGVLVR